MASTCIKSIGRISRAYVSKSKTTARSFSFPTSSTSAAAANPSRNRSIAYFSRMPVELGCLGGGSLFPLHSAVAEARLTSRLSSGSRSCRALSQGILCRTYPGL